MIRKKKKQLMTVLVVLIVGVGLFIFLRDGKEKRVITQEQISPVEMLTMEEKLEDFEHLYSLIEKEYPLLEVNKRKNGIDWLKEKENFKGLIENTTTDEMFMEELKTIVGKLNDEHTYIVIESFFKNIYGIYNQPEYQGKREPWEKVLNDERVLERYRFDESQLKLLMDSSQHNLPSSNVSYFKSDIIIPDEVAYLKIRGMNPDVLESDGKLIREFLKEVSNYKKLIIDGRSMNSFAIDTNDYWIKNIVEPLLNEDLELETYALLRGEYGREFQEYKGLEFSPIKDLPSSIKEKVANEILEEFDYFHTMNTTMKSVDPVGFDGEIYVLIDERVYQRNEDFAAFCKNSGFATLVGKTTSGINHHFEDIFYSLPNSGILLSMRNLISLNNDGTIREEAYVVPDIEIDGVIGTTYDRDNAIQYVIEK